MRIFYITLLLMVTTKYCSAQSCYQETRKEAINTFSQKNFKRAKQVFNAAKSCPDKPVKNDLNYWIGRCDKGMNPKTQVAELTFAQKMASYETDSWNDNAWPVAVTKKSDWKKWEKMPMDNSYKNIPKVGFVNERGDLVIPCQFIPNGWVPVSFFNQVNFFSEGLACVVKYFDKEDYYAVGYIDSHGNTVIPFDFSSGTHFSEGLAAVCLEDLYYENKPCWFFINKKGERAFGGEYLGVQMFHEGMCRVKKDSITGWGFIDKTGRMVVEGKYCEVGDFNKGVAPVFSKKPEDQEYMCALVDKTGSIIGSCQFRPDYLDNSQLRACISYYHGDKKDKERFFSALKQYEKRTKEENNGKWEVSSYDAWYSCELGNLYSKGLGGAVKNTDLAIDYFKLAADNHPHSYFKLGYLYAELKDYENSRKYYQKLIEVESRQEKKKYSASALYNVGLQYYNGQGTKTDMKTAMNYFKRAKDAGGKSNCDDMIKKCEELIKGCSIN